MFNSDHHKRRKVKNFTWTELNKVGYTVGNLGREAEFLGEKSHKSSWIHTFSYDVRNVEVNDVYPTFLKLTLQHACLVLIMSRRIVQAPHLSPVQGKV